MSKRPRRSQKNTPTSAEIQRLVEAEVSRRLAQQSGSAPRPLNQDALFAQMMAQQAPARQGSTMFSPGAPLKPSPGLVDPNGPRGFVFPTGYNISSQPRSTESTSFETLRSLASLYDGIQLCEQVWLDTVAKLNLVVKPRPEIVAEQGQSASNTKYADKIRKYTDILSVPDPGNGYDLKTWLRAAVRDQLQIDAVCIYTRKNRAGGVFSLELVDGVTIKPLIDPRGRRPQPPYPAYQQFYYGVPDGWYTSEEMIYLRETPRTDSIYGLSRIERIILRVNQALRKQNKDLTRFTDGNIPPGLIEPPAESGEQWTPEQLAAYQTMWDAMLAGNDQARSRVKIMAPGSTYTPIEEPDIFLDFDRFLLNVTTACYSMTMADLGFTESVNKSSGDSQENVFYRRAVQPLMDRYAQLFTQILRNSFGEQDLIVTWGGFEEAEDFNAMATSYVALVNSGIISPTVAAHQLKLPTSGADIPVFVLVPGQGITFLEDAANPEMRKAANDAKKAGYEQASSPPPTPEPGQPNGVGVPPEQGDEKSQSDDAQAAKGDNKPQDSEGDKAKSAVPAKKPDVQRSVGSSEHTGMMVAFMLKPDAASQLALPDGEDPLAMHCTLAYLGDMNDLPGDDRLRPDMSPHEIKDALADFARNTQPLQGKTSGIARFAASGHSDGLSPIVALVNAPGLQDFRDRLVKTIEAAGYSVAKNFEYTPHVTLSYIPQDAPMPVNEVPSIPLVFDEICLAIGDEHSYFKIGQDLIEKSDDPSFFVQVVDNDDGEERAFNSSQLRDAKGRFASGGGNTASAPDRTKLSTEERLANLSNLMGSRHPHCHFDFSGCEIETAKTAATQIDKLFTAYPEVAKSVPYVGTSKMTVVHDPRFDSDNSRSMACVLRGGSEKEAWTPLFLNKDYFGNPRNFQETLDASKKSGWSATDSIEGLISHEFGHVVHFYLASDGSSKTFTEYLGKDGEGTPAQSINEYIKNNRESAKEVSEYARTDDREAVAEAFASYHHNPNPPAYANGLKGVVDKLLPNGSSSHWKSAKPKRLTAAQRNEWNNFHNDYLSTI